MTDKNFQCKNGLTVANTQLVTNATHVAIGSNVVVNGASTFTGNHTVTGDSSLTGNTAFVGTLVTVTANASFQGTTFQVVANSTFTGRFTSNGLFQVTGNTTLTGNTTITGTSHQITGNTTLNANLTIAGSSHTVSGATTFSNVVNHTTTTMKVNNLGTITTNTVLDVANAQFYTATIGGNLNFTLSNAPTTNAIPIILKLNNAGSYIVNFPGKFTNNVVPTFTASGTDIVVGFTHDGGATSFWTRSIANCG
jgi:hypothetical protein